MEERLIKSWGIIFEGPIRKCIRIRLGEALEVPEAQFPILTWLRKRVSGSQGGTGLGGFFSKILERRK